nr:plasmid stabilization protein [Kribbella shirazensis]
MRIRAAKHGRSMEAEVREILVDAVAEEEEPKSWVIRFHEAFAAIGGVELDIPPRTGGHREMVKFD